jgi:hypothetical protein
MAEVWVIAGDPAVQKTAVVRALHVIDASVEVVPLGRGVAFWNRPLPDLIVFGQRALDPPHPLLVKAAAGGAPTLLVTQKLARSRRFAENLVLPVPVRDVVSRLLTILNQPEQPPVRLAS